MSDKTRNKFNATKQQVKDLLNGIKVAKPIISLIRMCGEKEMKDVELQVQILMDSTNLQHLSSAFALLRSNGIEEKPEQKKLEENMITRFNQLNKEEEALSKEINELKKEINEYIYYIEETFVWVSEDTLRDIVPRCISLCDDEEFLVLLLILFNRCFEEEELIENEEVILDALDNSPNKSEIVMELNHNFDSLICYIKQK